MIIRGNTVSTNMPRGDFGETDSTKASFILNKPDVARAQSTADQAAKDALAARQTAEEALPKTGGQVTGDVTFQSHATFQAGVAVPMPTQSSHAVNRGYCDTVQLELTLAEAGWSGAAPYTQTLAVETLTQGRKARAYPRWPSQPDLTLREEAAKLSAATFAEGSATFSCWEEKPEVDIPILLEVYV